MVLYNARNGGDRTDEWLCCDVRKLKKWGVASSDEKTMSSKGDEKVLAWPDEFIRRIKSTVLDLSNWAVCI